MKNPFLRAGGTASALAAAALCFGLLANGVTREVPLGQVHGLVTMRENGRPLPGTTVIFRAQIEHEGAPVSRTFDVGPNGSFYINSLPAGEYTVEAHAKAHSMAETRIDVPEGQDTPVQLELEPNKPYLELSASQHVFTPDEKPSVLLDGFVPANEVDIAIYKAAPEKIEQAGGLNGTFEGMSSWRDDKKEPQVLFGPPVRQVVHKIREQDAEGTFNNYVEMEPLKPGVYWLSAKASGNTEGTYLNVTRLSLVAKHSASEAVFFASDIVTGKPVAGAGIRCSVSGKPIAQGTTDKNGVMRAGLGAPEDYQNVIAVAASGEYRAFTNFNSYKERDGGPARVFTYTDRPVYRPGDEIKFKGIIRKLVGNSFALPGAGSVEVKVIDPSEDLVFRSTLPVSTMGSFNGGLRLNKEAPTGSYYLVANFGGKEERHEIAVSAYRKPEFTVKVTPEKPYYVRGDTARMVVHCEYYFGGPVVGAKVSAYISRSPYWSYEGYEGEEMYSSESGGGEYTQDVEAVTDGSGKAIIEFETKQEGEAASAENDYLYTVTASVEEGDKYFDGAGSVKVTRGEFAVGLQTDKYVVAPGDTVQAKVLASSHDGNKPVAGQQVRIETGTETWTNNESVFNQQSVQTVTTNAQGEATLPISSRKGGSITIRAIALDDRGNEIKATQWLWVDAVGAEPGGPVPSTSIKLDKKKYNIGDTAKLLVQTDKPGGSALVTVEGEKVYMTRVVALSGKATVVEFPVASEYAPNAFVSVAYVKDKRFTEAGTGLGVDIGKRKLTVTISSDKADYKPGDTATYNIKTAMPDGSPAPAEVSLGIVDESIYAIREDTTDIVESFYPKRANNVSTSYSFPELYLDGGDKTPANIQVRSKFLDTAFWKASVMTNEQGEATIQVPLPDNLTSWRATVIAASKDTSVGQATMNVRARKDLMIRLQTPSFLVQQDTQVLTATINNDTGKEQEVHVDLQAANISVDGRTRQTVTVQPGAPATIEWEVTASRTGTATFTAKAWIESGDSDGVRMAVQIMPHARTLIEQSSGEIAGSEKINLALRPGADPNTGRVIVTISPSLATSLVQALDGLIDYPYGCVEQTMSRFLPAVVVSDTLKNVGLPPTPRSKEIPDIVREGYQRLKNMQHSDGSWGWWENDNGDPYMTAYVLEGLFRARKAGYPNETINTNTALDWAETKLKKPNEIKDQSERLYLIYTMALYGRIEPAKALLDNEDLNAAGHKELAFAALARHAMGDAPAAQTLLSRLAQGTTVAAATAHWDETWYGFETTARSLNAFMAISPDHPLVPKIVRYLMRARQGDMWMSTRDSTVVLIGLTQHLAHTKAGSADANISVMLNGTEYKRIQLTKASMFDPALKVEIPISALRRGDNELELRKGAGPTAYYALDFRQNVVEQRLGQIVSGNGISVTRQYFSMEAKKLEDGTMRLMPSDKPVDEVETGTPIRVVLDIQVNDLQEYIMIESPIPSNCRIMERGLPGDDEEWTWWWSRTSVYDDKIVFFASGITPGSHRIEYTMRAESPGVARAMPVVLSNMYDPKLRAGSSENRLEVVRP